MDSSAKIPVSCGGNGCLPSDASEQNLKPVIKFYTENSRHPPPTLSQCFLLRPNFLSFQGANDLVLEFDNMSKLAKRCSIEVPMEVVNMINDGKYPDEFTREVFNTCIGKNQTTKGKTVAMESLHGNLLQELEVEDAFSDEVEVPKDESEVD